MANPSKQPPDPKDSGHTLDGDQFPNEPNFWSNTSSDTRKSAVNSPYADHGQRKENPITQVVWIFLTFLMIAFILALPLWPFSLAWGYYPASGILMLGVLILGFMLVGSYSAGKRKQEQKEEDNSHHLDHSA